MLENSYIYRYLFHKIARNDIVSKCKCFLIIKLNIPNNIAHENVKNPERFGVP